MEQQRSRSSSVQSVFKFNLVFTCVLLWFSCFGCCGNFLVLQTGAITMMQQKRLKKGTIPTPKNKGKPTPVFATPRNTHCCACCDSLVLRQVYYGSQSPFFPWFSHDYSHCLFDSCAWPPGSQWCFSGVCCTLEWCFVAGSHRSLLLGVALN